MMLLAILFHGEQLIPFLIFALLTMVAVLSTISFFMVRAFRKRIGSKAFLFAPLPFVLAILVIWVISIIQAPNAGPPIAVNAHEAEQIIYSLPASARLSYSGVGFYSGKLYVGSNIGLFEIAENRVQRLYRPQKEYSVVSGPWIDKTNHLLWIMDDTTHEMLNFDGSNWKRIPMPTPGKGYYSRGDVLEGVRPIGNSDGFWLVAAGSAWKWSVSSKQWILVAAPQRRIEGDYTRVNELIGVLPIENKVLLLIRHESMSFLVHDSSDFHSDAVVMGDSESSEIPLKTKKFLSDNWVVEKNAAYICTKTGVLLQVTRESIVKVTAPGDCEFITTDSSDQLVASIRNAGIYRYDEGHWTQLSTHPYPSGEGEYWAYFAQNELDVAFAMTDKKGTAPTQLLVSHGGPFQLIRIP